MTHPAQPMTHIPAPPPVSPRPVDATVADPPSTSSGRFAQAAREDEYIFGADGRGKAAAWAADGKTAMGQAQTEGGISGGTQDGEILLEEAANSAEHEALVKMISDFDLDKAVVYSEILKPRFEEAY